MRCVPCLIWSVLRSIRTIIDIKMWYPNSRFIPFYELTSETSLISLLHVDEKDPVGRGRDRMTLILMLVTTVCDVEAMKRLSKVLGFRALRILSASS